jgi:hypothetical protein
MSTFKKEKKIPPSPMTREVAKALEEDLKTMPEDLQ